MSAAVSKLRISRRGLQAVHAGHDDVEQIEREVLPLCGVHQLDRAAEGPHTENGIVFCLPELQKLENFVQFLQLIVTNRNIHRFSPPVRRFFFILPQA